ncbi:MAG TPA: glycosyl hydrolase family 18 protein [Candidatus Acidoferrales bacterium]|nr:glycosyl hydrolase family 18 protein [Candidatus Acidoferrales bacterium]
MKRLFLVILIFLVTIFIAFRVIRAKVGRDFAQPVYQAALTPTPTVVIDPLQHTDTSLFVPNWTLDTITGDYDQYIYFGVAPTKTGIDTAGAAKEINVFLNAVPPEKKTLLTLEMENTDINGTILQNKSLTQKVASQTVALAKENGFSGIVLDLEMGGIPFDSLINEINSFTKELDTQAKAQHLQFDVTLYGDTFYRLRPFDVKTISKSSDMVMIMAYDFHKARSNPGPNFPLNGKNTYGYDMGQMADDFLQAVPNQKLGVIFGMFGYDWSVDDQGNAVGQGVALTESQIQSKFLHGCQFKDCQILRDPLSSEMEIHYTDDANQKHIVWFEDMQSVSMKEQMLRKKGIGNFSFWANSYF